MAKAKATIKKIDMRKVKALLADPEKPTLLRALNQADVVRRGALAMLNATTGDILTGENLGWVADKLADDADHLEKMLSELHEASRIADGLGPSNPEALSR